MGVDGRATGESFAALWQHLDRERQARGWTRDRLARRTSQLSKQPYAEKTLHDRMAQGRRVPWDQVVWIVRALELDEQSWKRRWEQANNTRHRDRDQSGSQPPAEPSTTPKQPFWRSRFAIAASGFLAGVAVTLIMVWVIDIAWLSNDRSQSLSCALVSSPAADVFLTPNDPEPLFIKQRGDQITLPIDTPATVATNGDRYRLVRTSRTRSGYAYMREDALTSAPC
jgi:hypothetical protein